MRKKDKLKLIDKLDILWIQEELSAKEYQYLIDRIEVDL